MVLVPTRLYTETPEKICFHLYDLNETVTVRASLQFRSGSRSLFNELVVDKDLFHCVSFTVSTGTGPNLFSVFMDICVQIPNVLTSF